MNNRLELHEILCDILGSRNVYYQPPENIKMSYPAIVYSRDDIMSKHGDNLAYIQKHAYSVTLIDKNPDSDIVDKIIAKIKYCRYVRNYKADNLNHDIFLIYF